MGAVHAHNASLHSGPPNPNGTKRSRKERGKAIDLAQSDNEKEEDLPFTLKMKGKSSSNHQIIVKHEHATPPTSSFSSSSSSSSSSNLSLNERAISLLDKKIKTLQDIIATYKVDDDRSEVYQDELRELLIKKLGIYKDEDKGDDSSLK